MPVPAVSTSIAILSHVATSSFVVSITGGVVALYEVYANVSIVILVLSISTVSVTFLICIVGNHELDVVVQKACAHVRLNQFKA